jgi:hypothetical protein
MLRRIEWSTVLKLIVISLVVGTILAALGADPFDFWSGLWQSVVGTFEALFGFGWNGLVKAIQYTLVGAAVVVPIWLGTVLFKRRRPNPPAPKDEPTGR